jgi:TonB-linked SusC/RagA family outer membrane protein
MQGNAIRHLLFAILRNVFNLILVMRTTAIIFLAGFLQVSAHGYAQEKITLSEKNAPLLKVLDDIQKQTVYNIWYDKTVMPQTATVSIEVKDAGIEQTLDLCLSGLPLKYSMVGKNVVIEEKDKKKNTDPPNETELKGKVVNEKGEPLEGVAVVIKSSKKGTQTDASGNFILTGLQGNEVLIISSIGYETQEISLNGMEKINIRLKLSLYSFDETVVKGYYNTTRRLNTGNVSTVKAETISEQPVSNPLAAMEGRVAGLFITPQTGVPGSGYNVILRGQSSIASGNDPLYIVDGVPYPSQPVGSTTLNNFITVGGNPLSNINPADIESIDILKDADATAIYGSRGANGVILITTKKGRAGKTKLDINCYAGTGQVSRMMKLLNTEQYLAMRHEAFLNDGQQPNPGYDYDLTAWDTTRYTDWQKKLIGGTAQIIDAQGNISGGNENTQFIIGLGYHHETTVFPGSFADGKASAHFSLNHTTADKKINIAFSGSYMNDVNNLFQQDITTQAITLAPNTPPVYDSTGKLNWGPGTFANPFSLMQRKYMAGTDNIISHLVIGYKLSPDFEFKLSLGYTKISESEIVTYPLSSFDPAYGIRTGFASFASSGSKTWIVEPQLNYQKKWGMGKFHFLAGATLEQNSGSGQTLFASGFTSDALLENIGAATGIFPLAVNSSVYKYAAVFCRINYDWKEKYLLNLTGRRDGSSRFGPGRQYANFGAAGIGWIFSSEPYIRQNLSFISFGKLRTSYGISGNDQIGDYQYLNTYSTTSFPYLGSGGLYPTQLYNPDYAWEINRKWEVGLDLGFLKNRIMISAAYYRNRSSNQLVGYPVPWITGFNSITANFPAVVQNTGIELEFNTINIRNAGFTWTSTVTLTLPENKLISYPNLAASAYATSYVIGKSLYIKPAFQLNMVDPQTGLYQFQTKDGSGIPSNPADLEARKTISQTAYGGLQNSLQWKGWKLDIFFQFVKQTGYNFWHLNSNAPGMPVNQPTLVLDRWQKVGDKSPIQQFTQGYGEAYSAFTNMTASDNAISDASFLRLKNLAISYTLPIMGNQYRFYLLGQNLLTFTHYFGLDPQIQRSNNLPVLRIITAGVQIILN